MGGGIRKLMLCQQSTVISPYPTRNVLKEIPNVMIACLALVLRIREVPSSNLFTETGVPEKFS